MTVGVFGAGRLGSAIRDAAASDPDIEIAWIADVDDEPSAKVDVAIDASVAAAVPSHFAWAMETRTNLVIGVTGWSMPELRDRVGNHIGVLVCPNFSLTVALMQRFAAILGSYGDLSPDADLYVLEHHHNKKADAPSGTAKSLATSIISTSKKKIEWTMETPRNHQLSVGVVRAGAEFGTHTIGLDTPAETLTITHRARSRAVFAEGAIRAARWIVGKNGVYQFADLAAELLDPLFR